MESAALRRYTKKPLLMNPRQLVRLSNLLALVAVILLIYWVTVFITIQVFGLRVFKENLTESFYLSILGILAMMSGALIINIMFNLTRIAEKHNDDHQTFKRKGGWLWLFLISLPVIIGGLFIGDYLTSKQKEKHLLSSASEVIDTNASRSQFLLDYEFNEGWIIHSAAIMSYLSKTDKNFPNVEMIVRDSIEGEPVYLKFGQFYGGNLRDTIAPDKNKFIRSTTQEERVFLKAFFNGEHDKHRYSAHDGQYELFYPYVKDDKTILLYFSDRQRYGKLGSS